MALSLLLSIFLLWSLLSTTTTTTAFNITKILDQHPRYNVFNELLTKTHVAHDINKRKSVTILVVPNGAMSGIASQDEESLKVIMKLHVVLDYYDSAKFKDIENNAMLFLTTLYQTTGSADREEGFLKVDKDNNVIKVSSAASGSSVSARVSKFVTSIPSEISVVEVSNAIMPPGLHDSPSKSDSPAPSPHGHGHEHKHAPWPPSKSDSPAPSGHEHKHAPWPPSKSDSPAPSPHKYGHEHKHAPWLPSKSVSPAPSPHGHGNEHKHAPWPPSKSDSEAPSDDADAVDDDDDADADADDALSPDNEMNDSSSPRNVVVSGFMILLALLFAML